MLSEPCQLGDQKKAVPTGAADRPVTTHHEASNLASVRLASTSMKYHHLIGTSDHVQLVTSVKLQLLEHKEVGVGKFEASKVRHLGDCIKKLKQKQVISSTFPLKNTRLVAAVALSLCNGSPVVP